MRISAEVDERTLREIYLPAFERVVNEAAPTTVMSAYNAINGVFASENRWLLTELLREEWGFDGLVVSDWGAMKDRVAALVAGLDLEMPGTGGEGTAAIVDAVAPGRIDRSTAWSGAFARLAELGRSYRGRAARRSWVRHRCASSTSRDARPRSPSCCCATSTQRCRLRGRYAGGGDR